jgi:acyl-coenzyme A synthetase/AMP-(fatty) acid ligase
MYRTGDIVRRLDDDTFAFVGRRDLMVKCSGFRIELQEVEHVLQQHPRVLEAVVAPWYHDRRGSCSLAAFVSAKGGSDMRVIDLKKYCSERMPSYMVPETIEIVAGIPKNANGKVDRACVAEWVGGSAPEGGES